MLVDVVIVNWNAGQQLAECVDSVIKYSCGFVGRIIVVDNGSSDGSGKLVADLPEVTLICAGENLGFGKGCNLGAMHSASDFLLFLNPDARLFADSLPKVVGLMRDPENSRVGICGVQLVGDDGRMARSCSRFPSPIGFFAHAVGLDRIFPSLGHAMREWDHSATRLVDQVIGAFFFIRSSVFESLDGFDEQFFVYFEEVDISYRAKQMGWLSLFFADVQAFHFGGGSSAQVKARRLFYSLRSRILYSFKHFSPFDAVLVTTATLFIEPFTRSFLALCRASWLSIRETWAAYGMLLRWLSRWFFDRVAR